MIRINLLPFRAKRKIENVRRQASIYFGTVIILVLVIVAFYLTLDGKVTKLRADNSQLNKKLNSYAEMVKKIDELKKKIGGLRVKLDVIRRLEEKKAGPVQLFDEVAMAVPKGKLFLKSLSESKGTVRMAGRAIDNDTVALFMTNLERIKTIKSVVLGRATRNKIEERTVSDFDLTCEIAGS